VDVGLIAREVAGKVTELPQVFPSKEISTIAGVAAVSCSPVADTVSFMVNHAYDAAIKVIAETNRAKDARTSLFFIH